MSKAELFLKLDEMKEIMGTDQLLNEICQAMSSQEMFDNLEFVDRMHDLNLFNKDERHEDSN